MAEQTTTQPAAAAAADAAAAAPAKPVNPHEPVFIPVNLPPVPPEMLKTTRVYEVLVLFEPTEATKSWDKLLEWAKGLIEQRHHGLVLKHENWGDSRKLAYEIKGLRRGTYMLIYFRMKPAEVNAFDAELRIDDKVVRHMVVHHEKMPDALTGRVRTRIADEFEDEDFGGRRDDDWGDDDYGYDD